MYALLVRKGAIITLLLLGAMLGTVNAQRPPTAASLLVFDGVTVVDVEQGRLMPNQRVVIAGNHIQSIGRREAVRTPNGARIVDSRGKYLIPGLWDIHVHPMDRAPDYFYPLFLANGITGIRDAFSTEPLDTQIRWRREILDGQRPGPPRQILSGVAIDEQEHCDRAGLVGHVCVSVGDSVGARHLVDTLKALGVDMLKMYDLSKEMYFTIAAEARRVGLPFGGHLMDTRRKQQPSAAEASDSGARIIDHMNTSGGLASLCIRPGATVERCRPLAERFERNGTWFVPTIIPMRSYLGFPVQPRSDSIYKWLGTLAPALWDGWVTGTVAPAGDSRGILAILRDAGMPILAGTDIFTWDIEAMPGLERLHVELELYAAEGLTPLEALRTATLNPAKMLHATDTLGTVAPGKLADLVLLDADPLADITNTTTIRGVVANGRYFDRAELDKLLVEVRVKAKSP